MEPTDIKAIADMTHQIIKPVLEAEISADCKAKLEKEYVLIPKRTWLRFLAYTITIPLVTAGVFIGAVNYFLSTKDALTAASQIKALKEKASEGNQTIQAMIKSLQGGDQTKGYFRLGDTIVCYGKAAATIPHEATHTRKVAFDFPTEVQYSEPPQVTLTAHSMGGSAMFAICRSQSEKERFSASLNNTRQWSSTESPHLDGGVTTVDVEATYIAIGKGKITPPAARTP